MSIDATDNPRGQAGRIDDPESAPEPVDVECDDVRHVTADDFDVHTVPPDTDSDVFGYTHLLHMEIWFRTPEIWFSIIHRDEYAPASSADLRFDLPMMTSGAQDHLADQMCDDLATIAMGDTDDYPRDVASALRGVYAQIERVQAGY